jgi:DNA sulfur modification protein DndB
MDGRLSARFRRIQMATALPAMKGRFGSIEYYLVTMRAKELSEKLLIPRQWNDMTLEERFQREIDYTRVRRHIAPYLTNDPDRFFGAFIVDIFNPEGVDFEPLETVVKNLPGLYKKAAETFGFLTLQGNEVLVPLDGQHRLAAIRFAISGRDEKQKSIEGFSPNIDVANDFCTVILVKHDTKISRKIFNKVNRYAKATTKADNLITADDDIVAVVTREEVADKIIGERLVNYQSNTLSKMTPEFTTLSALYEATAMVLEDQHGKIDRTVLPSDADQKLYKEEARHFWQTICDRIMTFQQAIQHPQEEGDATRREIREAYTLGKPIVQMSLVEAIVRLGMPQEDGSRLGLETICDRINSVDWSVDNPVWQRVLMNGNKVVTGRQAARFAARFIAYLLGERLHEKEVQALEEVYAAQFSADEPRRKLPQRLYQPG